MVKKVPRGDKPAKDRVGTRRRIARALAKESPAITARDADRLVSRFLEELADALLDDGRVWLRGFGTFGVVRRKPKNIRDPITGGRSWTDPRWDVEFAPGNELRAGLDGLPAPEGEPGKPADPPLPPDAKPNPRPKATKKKRKRKAKS